jgi:23S rRNA (adenine2503-C2)-methyltransferase
MTDSIDNSNIAPKPVILDMDLVELQQFLRSLGEPGFRAKQIAQWVYSSLVFDFDRMTNLPQGLRKRLEENALVMPLKPVIERADDAGMTYKTLFALLDGRTIESVLMLYGGKDPSIAERRTVCVSSQVGCAIGCAFCVTGKTGFERNLTAGEIVAEVLYFAHKLTTIPGAQGAITNVVYMGQGEPLANFEQVWKSIELLNSPSGFNLGARHITLSTAGLVPGIVELGKRSLQVGLAVSLHAPNDALRDQLVPVNRSYPLATLMAACREYIRLTNRRITFEYALIHGMNDTLPLAQELANLLQGMLCHVNLIPLNPGGTSLRRSSRQQVLAFQAELNRRGIPTTVRAERGGHIEAACGQLKSTTL